MNDETMADELKAGEDLHMATARDIMSVKSPDKSARSRAKAVNFGLIFGMGPSTFKDYAFDNYGVTFTDKEAEAIHRA